MIGRYHGGDPRDQSGPALTFDQALEELTDELLDKGYEPEEAASWARRLLTEDRSICDEF